MAEPVVSKTFWKCIIRTDWPDFLDVATFLLEITSILFNSLALFFLCKKHAGPRVSLVLLRGMITCYLLSSAVNFTATVYPYKQRTQSYNFNRFICLFWDSRFFYWIFNIMGELFLATFSTDRFVSLAQLDHFRVTLPKYRCLTYVVFVVVSALLLSLPQLLTVNLQGDNCDCAPIQVNIPFLSLVYAHVYVWVSILLVFQDGLLSLICAQLIRWKLNRLPANHTWRSEDDLNGLTLKEQTPAADTLSLHPVAQLTSRRSWSSASLCILPLTVSYVLTNVYDSIYQFLSAVGLTTFIINSSQQRLGSILIQIHSTVVPLIICYYIPSLRVSLKSLWEKIRTKAAHLTQ